MNKEIVQLPPEGGVIVLDKPEGITSHEAVQRARRLFGTKQVGHTGTLDPLATGVLCLLVGRAVKASEYSLAHRKSYEAVMRIGLQTDTGDITGNVINTSDKVVPCDCVINKVSGFCGNIMQLPPMYSALKVNGQKLCDVAREGGYIERSLRPVTVYSIEAEHISGNDYRICTTVSSGTYIRTLCEDIGAACGFCATMVSLRRTAGSGFDISEALTLEGLESMTPGERTGALLPVERLFRDLPKITLPAFYERLFRNGCEIYLKKIGVGSIPDGTLVRVYTSDNTFFAVGKIGTYENGTAVKSDKILRLTS